MFGGQLARDLNSLQRESVSTGKRKQEREDRTVGWGENPIGFGSFFYTQLLISDVKKLFVSICCFSCKNYFPVVSLVDN